MFNCKKKIFRKTNNLNIALRFIPNVSCSKIEKRDCFKGSTNKNMFQKKLAIKTEICV